MTTLCKVYAKSVQSLLKNDFTWNLHGIHINCTAYHNGSTIYASLCKFQAISMQSLHKKSLCRTCMEFRYWVASFLINMLNEVWTTLYKFHSSSMWSLLKKKFYLSVFFISVGFILWDSSQVFFILWFLSLVFFILWDSSLVFFILVVFIFVGFIFVGYIFVGFVFVGFMFVGFIFVGFIFWDSSCGIHSPSRLFRLSGSGEESPRQISRPLFLRPLPRAPRLRLQPVGLGLRLARGDGLRLLLGHAHVVQHIHRLQRGDVMLPQALESLRPPPLPAVDRPRDALSGPGRSRGEYQLVLGQLDGRRDHVSRLRVLQLVLQFGGIRRRLALSCHCDEGGRLSETAVRSGGAWRSRDGCVKEKHVCRNHVVEGLK